MRVGPQQSDASSRTAQSRTRRRYESPRRVQHAAQTRAEVLDAAIRLFGENGWAGTGMRDVARVAGVAVETVYSNFGSKPELLLAALDVAVVGDIQPIPLGERPEFAALGRGSLSARARAAAQLIREINERSSGIGRALREAAAGDAELAKRLTEGEERRRINVEPGRAPHRRASDHRHRTRRVVGRGEHGGVSAAGGPDGVERDALRGVAGRHDRSSVAAGGKGEAMTGVRDAPADTRMMGIVHDALRRDFGRAIDVLSTAPYPDGGQRTAIGDHVGWMMSFLHAHHHGEDAGLWPLVRERNPQAATLLDAMEADHVRVAPLVEACDGAAHDYRSTASDETRVALLGALRGLCEVLLPHLEREEHETMPLVSVTISAAEWHAIDQQYYIKPKSLPQLGFEGHWLLDGLDPERSHVVVHEVPPIPRFVLVHGFARRYRQRATACWGPSDGNAVSRPNSYGPAAKSPRRIPRTGHVDTVVAAPIVAVWNVVTDVTRVGEWSHECRSVEWLDGATDAEPGRAFAARTRRALGRGAASTKSSSPTNRARSRGEPSPLVAFPTAACGASSSRPSTTGRASRSRSRSSEHRRCSPLSTRSSFQHTADAARASPTTCAGSARSLPRTYAGTSLTRRCAEPAGCRWASGDKTWTAGSPDRSTWPGHTRRHGCS